MKKGENMDNLETMRHSLSHVLAAAVKKLYPDAKFGIGPAIDSGFYYDIDFGTTKVTDRDLAKVEKEMRKIIAKNPSIKKRMVSKPDALKWAKDNHQDYKTELINDLPEDAEISFYDLGNLFTDLCKGPHLENLSNVGSFKLSHIAGAYWRGDEKRPMLTRIYGIAFSTQQELEAYEKKQEDAKARDHRKIGAQLDLFCFPI